MAANFRAALPPEGSISDIKNTSDDGSVTVGEDDKQATNVLQDWQVTGNGQITVTVTGQAGGLGNLTSSDGRLSFTGTAEAVNAWLDGIKYQYTQNPGEQKQSGDSYSVKLTFTTFNSQGEAKTETHTQRIDIAPQNDATVVTPPAGGKPHASVPEGGSFNFGNAITVGKGFTHEMLGLSDPDNSASQVLLKLESIPDPKHGTLVLTRNGQELILAVGSTLSAAELGNLEYRTTGEQVSPANGAAKTPLQSFKFTIDDGAGGRSTGNVVNIELTPINQAPSMSGSVVIVEGESDISLGAGGGLIASRPNGEKITILGDRGSISGIDADDKDLTYTITSLPAYGTLKYNGKVLTAANIGTTVITDLNKLTYSYPSDANPSDHGGKVSIDIEVRDNGGGAGTNNALVTKGTVELTILENNDDPSLLHNEPQDYEKLKDKGQISDNSFTITEEMLSVTDEDSQNPNLVFRVTGGTDPELGYFTVNGKLLAAGTSFTMQDVIDGKVQYHLRTSSTNERTDSFTFEVVDSATGLIFGADGTAYQRDGGIYVDGSPTSTLKKHTFEVKVPASEPGQGGKLPDLPPTAQDLVTNGDLKLDGVREGQGSATGSGDGVKITRDDLYTTDGVSDPEKIVYRLETLPTSGTLTLDGKVLKQFDSFTQADIDAGKVKFQHLGGEQFTDSFQFSVSNGAKTSDGLKSFEINSIPQNDTPTASQGAGMNVLEGDNIVINGSGVTHIVLSDRDQNSAEGGYANSNELSFVVTKLPEHGELVLNGKPVKVGQTVTKAQLDAGELSYKHNGSENFKDSFVIQPYDNQKVGTSETDTTAPTDTNQPSKGEPVEIKITIAPDNDAPELEAKQELQDNNGAKNGLYEGGSAVIWGNDLSKAEAPYGQLVFKDADNTDPQQIQYRVTEASQYGQLVLKQADGSEIILVKGSTFTQDDLNNGRIEYRHNGGENHTDTFKYLVSDGDHSVNDGSNNENRKPGDTIAETEGSEFKIHVKPSNDKPLIVQKPSKPVVVDGADSSVNKAPGFKVGDIDLPDAGAGGDTDLITVIVRVTTHKEDKDKVEGTPLTGTDYTLKVTDSTGLLANSITSANGGSSGAGYLVLTGSKDAVNKALASLEVGFSEDTNTKYQLQVIADDRLNAAGDGYQNGGDKVKANGGDKNRPGKSPQEDIDETTYDWGTAIIKNDTSFNLSVAEVELWVSTANHEAEITTTPPAFSVYEDVPTKLGKIEIKDDESSAFGTWVEVKLTVDSGTLTTKDLPDGIEISGDGTGNITLKGSVDKINAFLKSTKDGQGVFYTSAANDNADHNGNTDGDVTLTIELHEGASNIGTPNADGTSNGDPANGGSAIGGDAGSGSPGPSSSVSTTVAITVLAANDAPTASNGGDRVVITDPTTPQDIGGFTVADNDDADFESAGETDFIQVTVRLLDKDGNPLKQADYEGVTLGIKDGSGIASGGIDDVLVLRGTVAEVQAALAKLQITLDNSGPGKGLGNADNPYKVQIIADDRLRDSNGKLIGGANGGDKNNKGTGVDDINSDNDKDINVYITKDFGDFSRNIATAERTIWPSSTNELPVIERTPSNVQVYEDVYTFIGKGFIVTDAESDQFGLPVQITIDIGDKGTLSVGGSGTLSPGSKIPGTEVTVVSGDESGTLKLEGTASAISALLKDPTNGLFFTSKLNDNADHNGADDGDITAKLIINEYKSATEFKQDPQEVESTFSITVNPVNDAPVLGGTTNNGTYQLYPDRVNGSNNGWHWSTGADDHDSGIDKPSHDPIKLISSATVTDVDLDAVLNGTGANSFGGGTITVKMTGGYVSGDLLAVAQMAGIKEGGISGGNGSDLVIKLSATATAEQVKAILEAITFDNDGDPSEGGKHTTRAYSVVLNDGNNNNGSANAGSGGAKNSNALTGTLTFQRYEAPVANADTAPDTVVSGGKQTTTGNVLTNDTDKVLVGDTANTGKTNLTVTQVTGSSDPAAVASGTTTTVQGTYGTLTIKSDGSYTYTLDPTLPAYKTLVGDTVQETFSYRSTDAQGLSADSTLTIDVTGIDDPVTVTVNPDNTDHTVYESHLPDGSEVTKDDTKLSVDSSFTVLAPDGLKEEITISFTGADGQSQSITLSKAELDALSPSSPKVISTPYGELKLTGYTLDAATNTATVNYGYTLTNAPEVPGSSTSDTFVVTGADQRTGTNTGKGTITITIMDDAPKAENDTNSIKEDAIDPITGNVLGGIDASAGDKADTLGADGAIVSHVTGTNTDKQPVDSAVTADKPAELAGQYGTLTLNADGSYSYTLDNSNLAVQGLKDGETLTETYTYTITDKDGDTSTATLTITINGADDGVTVKVPNTSVEPVPSQPDGKTSDHVVFESGLIKGSNPNTNDTLVESSFIIQALDGVGSVTITLKDGQTLTLTAAELEALSTTSKTLETKYGTLTLKGYTQADDGTITVNYTYTLTKAPQNASASDNLVKESFTVTTTDRDGDKDSAEFAITIVDDAPKAENDTNSIKEDATSSIAGNVLGNDKAGADGWKTTGTGSNEKVDTVVGVESGTPSDQPTDGIGQGVKGEYGTLTLNADGSYSYTLDNSNLAVQGLKDGETLTETYTYTITDKDGDTSTATLTITINGADDGVTVKVPNTSVEPVPSQPDGKTSDHVVFESGLIKGSNPNTNDTLVESSFTIKALDGVGSVTITLKDGEALTLTAAELEALSTTSKTLETKYGTLTLKGYTQADDGTITVDYTYTLTKAPQNASASDNLVKESFTVTTTDRDGDKDSAEFAITIVDDAPKAEDDRSTVDNGSNTAAGNVLGNDTQGADRDTTVTGITSSNVPGNSATKNSDGDFIIKGEHGTLTIKPNGSYEYERSETGPLSASDVFEYIITDKDGDPAKAKITITIADHAPVITDKDGNPPTLVPVDPADPNSPTRPVIHPDGPVNEGGLTDGSTPGKGNTTTGTITLTPGDDTSTVTVTPPGGSPVTLVPDVPTKVTTPQGEVTLTYTEGDPSTGTPPKITYEYELKTPVDDSSKSPTDEFNVTVTDKDGDSTTVTVVVEIVDDVPVATNDAATVDNGSNTATGNALGNDTLGADRDTLVSSIQGPNGVAAVVNSTGTTSVTGQYGTLSIDAQGNYTYTRFDGSPLNATEVFDYTITDKDGDTSSAKITITIADYTPVITDKDGNPPALVPVDPADPNSPTRPVIHPDGPVNEGGLTDGSTPGKGHTTTGTITLTPGDDTSTVTVTPPGGSPVTLVPDVPTKVTTPQGEVTLTYTEGDPSTGTPPKITYEYELKTPVDDSSKSPTDEFNVTVTDKDGDSTTVTVVVEIVDDVPVATNDAATVDNGSNTATGNALGNDTLGADRDTLVSSAKGSMDLAPVTVDPVSGNITVTGQYGSLAIKPDGSYTYTRDDGSPLNAIEVFDYTITDKDGDTSAAKITITIADKAPSIAPPPTSGNTPGNPTVNESGIPGGSAPDSGSNKVTGSLVVEPSDEGGTTVTVTPPGGTPVNVTPGQSITVTTPYGEVTVTYTLGNGTDKPSISYEYELKTPTDGSSATPPTDSFIITVTDGDGDSTSTTVTIDIVDDVPDARDDGNTTLVNVPVTGQLGGNDQPGADGIESWTLGAPPQHGTVVIDPSTGQYTFTPNPGFVGTDTFTYTVTDKDGSTSTATVTITVTNQPPVAVDDSNVSEPGKPATGNVLTGGSAGDRQDSDPDGQPVTVTEITVDGKTVQIPPNGSITVDLPNKGTLVIGSDGSYSFTPLPMWGGQVPDISYTISDGAGGTDTAVLRITVTAIPSTSDVPPRIPVEIPSITNQGERPLYDMQGKTPWTGNQFYSPSVFWESHAFGQKALFPQPFHPVVYVNEEVVRSQELHRLYETLNLWSNWFNRGDRLSSSSRYLAADTALFVQQAVRDVQWDSSIIELQATNRQPNLPTAAPGASESEQTAQPLPESLNSTAAFSAEPQQAEQVQRPAKSSEELQSDEVLSELLQRWNAPEDQAGVAAESGPITASRSSSFTEQLQQSANALPSHIG